MKSLPSVFLAFLLCSALFSCQKKKDEPSPQTGSGSWQLGDRSYRKGTSAQDSREDLSVVVASTVGLENTYGAFSGSALTIAFYTKSGVGEYTIASREELVKHREEAYLSIECIVGTAVNTGAVQYAPKGISGVKARVSKDADGKYHVSISNPVTLHKAITTGAGIPEAAESYPITVQDVY